jgi:hypothetical protein
MRFDSIFNFVDRLSTNKELLINSRTTLDIFFPEYDNDLREIFQIPEIMQWLKSSVDVGVPWFYFLDYENKNTGLHLLTHSCCHPVNISMDEANQRYIANYDGKALGKFMERNFVNMNLFMNKNDLSNDLNMEISDGIIRYFENHLI